MAVIHWYGGGFTGGSKNAMAQTSRVYAERGYVAIAAQYRLANQSPYPGLVHDAKAAIRWTRAHAKDLGIEPQRIAVAGYSAGGYLALFTAGTGKLPQFEGDGGNPGVSSEVAACLAYYPAGNITNALISPAGLSADERTAANSATHIAAGFPPTIIFHGVADATIRIESSQRMFQQFRDAGVPVEMHAYEGAAHGFDSTLELAESCAQLADLFMNRHILNPHTYPAFGAGRGGAGRGGNGAANAAGTPRA